MNQDPQKARASARKKPGSFCWLLLWLAALSPARAEEKPVAAAQSPDEFIQENRIRFIQELEELKKQHLESCGGLPSDAERLFSVVGLPEGRDVEITAEREFKSTALPSFKPELRGNSPLLLGRFNVSIDRNDPNVARSLDAARRFRLRSLFAFRLALASDNFTADLLDMPRSVAISVPGAGVQLGKKKYTITVGPVPKSPVLQETEDPEIRIEKIPGFDPKAVLDAFGGTEKTRTITIEGDEIINEFSARDIRSVFSGFITVEAEGADLDDNGTRLFLSKPGRYQLKATARRLFTGISQETFLAQFKAPAETKGDEFLGLHADRVGFLGIDLEGPAPTMDLFDPRPGTVLGIEPRLILTDGEREAHVSLPALKARINLLNPGPYGLNLEPGENTRLLARYLGGHGMTECQVEVAAGGQIKAASPLRLTVNRVRTEIDPPLIANNRLSLGQAYDVRVIVNGLADMTLYKIKWDPMHFRTGSANRPTLPGVWAASSQFDKAGPDTWIASNRLRVDPKANPDFKNSDFQRAVGSFRSLRGHTREIVIAGEIIPKEGRSSHGRLGSVGLNPFPTMAPPRVSKIELLARREGEEELLPMPATLDLFAQPLEIPERIEFFAHLEFSDGSRFEDINLAGLPFIEMVASGDSLLRSSREGFSVARAGLDFAGKTELKGIARAERSIKSMGITLGETGTDLDLGTATITVNRLVLSGGTEGDGRRVFRLAVFGPADLSNYQAEFQFRQAGLNNQQAFKKESGVFVSSVREPSPDAFVSKARRLESALLRDSEGQIVAKINAQRFGGGVRNPKVSIQLPETAPIDGRIVISALIEDLPFEFWNSTVCRWKINPAIGKFKADETGVDMQSESIGRSIAVLDLGNRKDNIGKIPPVTVELVLKATRPSLEEKEP